MLQRLWQICSRLVYCVHEITREDTLIYRNCTRLTLVESIIVKLKAAFSHLVEWRHNFDSKA